jgi:hypothetical protein
LGLKKIVESTSFDAIPSPRILEATRHTPVCLQRPEHDIHRTKVFNNFDGVEALLKLL